MKLLDLLRTDAKRQFHFAGVQDANISALRLFKTCLSPRFMPVLLYRLAFWCARHRLRQVGRIFSVLNFMCFGIEIALECEIGPGLFFPHTVGTVIGAKAIGSNAVIYHNVTIGAKTPDLAFDGGLRPIIGNGVFLGAGCKILGSITIGDGVAVGANAVVLTSVEPGCLVGGIPAKVIRQAAPEEGNEACQKS